jgi:predicted SAM-dependent methyltransferase
MNKSALKSVIDKQKLRLDIGCGFNKQKGFTGLDKRALPGVDIVHDIEVFPWPLPDACCAVIIMAHIVEHIKPWLQIDMMNEAWRVMENDGLLMISTPYGSSFKYVQDPTHCAPWNEATPTYFIKGQTLYDVYKPKPWAADQVAWSTHDSIEISLRKIPE